MKKISLIVVMIMLCVSVACAETMYSWIDKNGVKRFGDSPPPDAQQVKEMGAHKYDRAKDMAIQQANQEVKKIQQAEQKELEQDNIDNQQQEQKQERQQEQEQQQEQTKKDNLQARIQMEKERLKKQQCNSPSSKWNDHCKNKISEKLKLLKSNPEQYFYELELELKKPASPNVIVIPK